MILPSATALQNAKKAGRAGGYPEKSDSRLRNGIVFPKLQPRFTFSPGERIFTLGSCFARNIEWKLPASLNMPVRAFRVPQEEWPGGANGILNEFNPGTMCQRIEHTARRQSFGEAAIISSGDGVIDLLLRSAAKPTSKTRLLERRQQIDSLYEVLFESSGIIITLGLIETWYDTEAGLFLNRIPSPRDLAASPDRYQLHILELEEAFSLLERMVLTLIGIGVNKILLTVSPVPNNLSFSGHDGAIADGNSKSVLRICANRLWDRYPEVDYFPSYEMARSKGPDAYEDDNCHVTKDVVQQITDHMVANYLKRGVDRPAG